MAELAAIDADRGKIDAAEEYFTKAESASGGKPSLYLGVAANALSDYYQNKAGEAEQKKQPADTLYQKSRDFALKGVQDASRPDEIAYAHINAAQDYASLHQADKARAQAQAVLDLKDAPAAWVEVAKQMAK